MEHNTETTIRFTSKNLDDMAPGALQNIIICIALGDDLSVLSLFEIIQQEPGFKDMKPSEVLKTWLEGQSGNSCQILGVYGSGGWFHASFSDD